MTVLLNELESIVTYLSSVFPSSSIERQNVPINPPPDTFVLKFTNAEATKKGEYTFIERSYSLIYIGRTDMDCLATVETLRTALQAQYDVIPLLATSHITRIQDFTFSAPFSYDDGSKGIIVTFTGQTQEQQTHEKGSDITTVNTDVF